MRYPRAVSRAVVLLLLAAAFCRPCAINAQMQWFDDLYGVKNISCPAAWDRANGSGVIVAVIDTGIDYRHRDITNQVWINTDEIPDNGLDDDDNGFVDDRRGWDFTGASYAVPQPDNDPLDSVNGHGTHVAGTIAAQGNNGRGIIGVAWGARVMAVRALDDAGYGANSALASAIRYAADNGADVLNASWGGKGTSPVIEDAINYATSLGVVFVAAAGNATPGNAPGNVEDFYPANVTAAIAVSAFTPNDGIAQFSNIGYGLDVGAPGMDVLSLRAANTFLGQALDDEYTRMDGTSMAAPHVAGTAALILSRHSSYAPEQVRQVLRCSADRVMAGSFDPYSGYGRVNASNALAAGSVLQTRILSPARTSIADPQMIIMGIATGPNFTGYTLDYGFGDQPSEWTVLAQRSSRVDHGTLGTLQTLGLPDGRYTVRLRAFNSSGAVFEDRLQIVVNYTFITSPERPVVPSLAMVHKPGAILRVSGTARSPNFQGLRVEWARGYDADFGWASSGVTLAGGGSGPITNAYRMNGEVARSWRLHGANGNQPHGDGNVVFGDFDHDGKADLAVNYMLVSGGGSSGFLVEGVLTLLRLNSPCRPHPRDWPMNFHDARNSAAGLIPAQLRVAGTGDGVLLSWPRQAEPAVLQGSDDISSGAWDTLAAQGVCRDGLNTIFLQSTNTRRWYRLEYK